MLWKVEWYSIQNSSFAVVGSDLKFIFTVCMYFLYFSVAQLDLKLKISMVHELTHVINSGVETILT